MIIWIKCETTITATHITAISVVTDVLTPRYVRLTFVNI